MTRRTILATISTVVFAFALTACASGAAPGSPPSEVSNAEIVRDAQARIEAATSTVGVTWGGSGVKAPAEKGFVVLVPCNQVQPGCTEPAIGAEEALSALGWRVQMIDGKGTGDTQNAAVQQALALSPDAILTFAIDPPTIQQSLAAAREQGVVVVSSAGQESDLVDSSVNPTLDIYSETGSLLADVAIADQAGEARALVLHDTGFSVLEPRYQAFLDRLSECEGCAVLEEQTFTSADLVVGLPRLVQQLAQRHPDFNTLYVDYDDAVPPIFQALDALGLEGKTILASNGTQDATQCIASVCGQTATTAFSLRGIGWAAVDQLIHILADEDPAVASYPIGVKLISAENAGRIDGMWDGDTDYRGEYLTRWGVAE